MTSFARILPSVLLLALLIVLAAGIGWLPVERRTAHEALAALKKIKQERTALVRQTPAPTEENERAIGRDLADTMQLLEAWRDVVVLGSGKIDGSPVTTTEAYFEIAAFVEKMRIRATGAAVSFKADEGFGFAQHAREGPAADEAQEVLWQCRVMQNLLESLIEARPLALVAVQRQRPSRPAGQKPAGTGPGDFFDCPEQFALRMPGTLSGQAFRLEFSGQTRVLRAFLNKLAAGARPVFVRSVEVEPLATEAVSPPPAGAPVPLVAQNFSRFTVIVETIRLADDPGGPAS